MKVQIPIFHKAISYRKFGNPSSVLNIVKIRCLSPGPNEIFVQMRKCSINPSDLITIRGGYSNRVFLPSIPGFEGMGVIVDMGIGVQHLYIGARVLIIGFQGTWQEYVLISAEKVILIPDEFKDKIAAQLYINPLSAWLMLKRLNAREGNTIAINAGNSAIGYVITKFSQLLKINIISIVRRAHCIESLKEAGAKFVINTSEVNLKNAISSYTQGVGVDFALDAIGGEDGAQLVDCVRDYGIMLHYGLLSGIPLPQSAYLKNKARNVRIENYFLRDWVYTEGISSRQSVFKEMMANMIKLNIDIPVEREYSISEISEAVAHAERPSRTGKILLCIRN